MYTREQLKAQFSVPPECTTLPQLTETHLDTLEAIQAAGADHGRQGFYPDSDFGSDADWCYGVGELINRLETELDIDDGSVFELYSEAHSESFQDGTINPEDRDSGSTFDFWFGAYGEIEVSIHARSLEAALELAADWLADNAPGYIMLHGNGSDKRDPGLDDLMAEACEELGLQWPIPDTLDWSDSDAMQPYWDAEEQAFADLTYTERGYLVSWEWTVNER